MHPCMSCIPVRGKYQSTGGAAVEIGIRCNAALRGGGTTAILFKVNCQILGEDAPRCEANGQHGAISHNQAFHHFVKNVGCIIEDDVPIIDDDVT